MMKKAAIIIASGFEEGEALTIADIIKRAHLQCDLVGFEQEVKGGHEILSLIHISFEPSPSITIP